MQKAEAVWNMNSESGKMTLVGRWNYHNELGAQFPILPLRVTYAGAGTLPASAIVRDRRVVIDTKLYWFVPSGEGEAGYLMAIFNSDTLRLRTARYQSRGAFGTRDFHKVYFNVPIPGFDPKSTHHADLAEAARAAEELAATVPLSESGKFQRARRLIRDALTEAGIASRIDKLVARLLDRE